MSGYTNPPDTRASGATGHITDHNNIADDLITLESHVADGLTGATAAYRLAGAGTSAGAPASGTFLAGDIYLDRATPTFYVCTTAGTVGSGAVFTQAGATLPMTTLGDLVYEDATPTAARLAGNTTSTKKFLTQTGTGSVSAVPGWNTISAGDVPTLNQNTSGTAAGLSSTLAVGSGGTGQTTLQAALDALAAAVTNNRVLAGDGTHVTLRALAAADLPAGSTSGSGVLQLDGTAGDIAASPASAAAAGATGKAADAAHAHPLPTNTITNAALAQMAARTIKGNQTGATANAADLTAPQAMSVLNGQAYALANGYAMP